MVKPRGWIPSRGRCDAWGKTPPYPNWIPAPQKIHRQATLSASGLTLNSGSDPEVLLRNSEVL